MPQFMLILRTDVTKDYSGFTPDDMQQLVKKYEAWGGKIAGLGLMKDGKKLTDEGGKVLHPQAGGDLTIKDGPYVETKEVVGGIYLIKADSYDHAAELCADHPNFLFGSIEIREVDFMGQPED